MNPINIYRRHREQIDYLFWGVMTTVVNFAVYFVCTRALNIHHLASNAAAWVVSVAFAYFVNKIFVFRAKDWTGKVVLREAAQFTSGRIASGVMEMVLLLVFVDWLGLPDAIIKVISNVLVIIVNYIISKFLVFKRKSD